MIILAYRDIPSQRYAKEMAEYCEKFNRERKIIRDLKGDGLEKLAEKEEIKTDSRLHAIIKEIVRAKEEYENDLRRAILNYYWDKVQYFPDFPDYLIEDVVGEIKSLDNFAEYLENMWGEEFMAHFVDYLLKHVSEIKKVGLKEGEGIEKLRSLKRDGDGVIQLFNAEYEWIPPFWKCKYMDGEEWVEDTYIIAGYPKTNESLGQTLSILSAELDDRIRVKEEHPSKHVGEDSIRITVFPEIRTKDGKVVMKKVETRALLSSVLLDFDDYLWGEI